MLQNSPDVMLHVIYSRVRQKHALKRVDQKPVHAGAPVISPLHPKLSKLATVSLSLCLYHFIVFFIVSKTAKTFAKALKKCTDTFGKCRKYEDDVGTAINACK